MATTVQSLLSPKLPKVWKKAHVNALLKPETDQSAQKNYIPISLLSHTYKLSERLLLNRIGPTVGDPLVSEQAGFCPGKATTSQLLNFCQYIEDGFKEGKVTGRVLVYLSAAYNTVNHTCFLHKILVLTKVIRLTKLIVCILENRLVLLNLGSKKSKWGRLKNGL